MAGRKDIDIVLRQQGHRRWVPSRMAQLRMQYNVWNAQAETGAFGDDWLR